jgi:adenylosuccinate synthase
VSGLCVTKLDVMDGMDVVSLGVGYRIHGVDSDILPVGADALENCEAVYEEMPGWSESTLGVQRYADLPVAARNYLERIAEVCGVPIDMVSTGPDRDETIVLRHPFN